MTSPRLLIAGLYALGVLFLFRDWLASGFDATFGDRGDARIMIAILEHWFGVWRGQAEHWTDPLFFHPTPGTLGYTDSYFLYGLPYSVARALGADPFLAFMLVPLLLSVLGFVGFVRLAVRWFGVPAGWAAVGAFVFAFANMHALKLFHAQGYAAMLLPWVVDFALRAWQAAGWRQASWAGGAGLLFAAILLTAFQTGWFFALALLVAAPGAALAFGTRGTAALVRATASRWRALLGGAFALALGLVPFLQLYLPVVQEGRRRAFLEVVDHAPRAMEIVNVTPQNLVWGDLLLVLGLTGAPGRHQWEVELGYTPAVLAVMLLALAWAGLAIARGKADAPLRFLFAFGAAALAMFALQLDYGGVRPWAWIWAVIPGAEAVRYTYRSQLVVNLFAALVAAFALWRLSWRSRPAALAVAALLVVEQANHRWPETFSRAEEMALLRGIPPAPQGCRVFYLVPNPMPAEVNPFEHQAGAMLIAQVLRMPTVNGFSSWLPDGFGDVAWVDRPTYPAAVRAWAARHGLTGLCGLDPGAGRWAGARNADSGPPHPSRALGPPHPSRALRATSG